MYNNNTAAVIRRLKQLQTQFENALESGKTFEEVRTIYREMKSLIDNPDRSKASNMELRNYHSDNSTGGSYGYYRKTGCPAAP